MALRLTQAEVAVLDPPERLLLSLIASEKGTRFVSIYDS
jgi:hypothetical protein